MKIDCNVTEKTIETSYQEYIKTHGTDSARFEKMEIKFNENNALWRLWILALSYQAMSEKASQTIFKKIPKNGLAFNPMRVWEMAKECDCPFLSDANKVHFCNFDMFGRCSKLQLIKKCPIPKIRVEIRRLPRISKAIVSSALYLQNYAFDFEKLYKSLQKRPVSDRTQKILDRFTAIGGEKVAHMYLRWVSNSIEKNWELDTKRFLAIDVNIRRVTKNMGLCNSPNTNVIRAHLHELMETLKMDAPKSPEKLEIALLHVGQKYCDEQNRKVCKQENCPFY